MTKNQMQKKRTSCVFDYFFWYIVDCITQKMHVFKIVEKV